MVMIVNPNLYDNKCYIIAGGPSLKDFDWSLLTPDKFVIAINRSYEMLPDAQIIYFTDEDFWKRHKDEMLEHKGQLIRGLMSPPPYRKHPKTNKYIAPPNWTHPDVIVYYFSGRFGLDTTPGHLKHGNNSTYAAINLAAAHFKFKQIYLLGTDMKWGKKGDKSSSHWHGGHKRIDPESVFRKMMKSYNTIIHPLQKMGVQVYNVNTPDQTDLTAFPIIPFSQAF